MKEVFYLRRKHYNLCNLIVFAMDNPGNKFLLNSTAYRANQLCQTLSSEVKRLSIHHYNVLGTKSKLDAVINVSVKYAQGALPV